MLGMALAHGILLRAVLKCVLGVDVSSSNGGCVELLFGGTRFSGDGGARVFEAFACVHPFQDEAHDILRLWSFGRLGASDHDHDFAAHLGCVCPVGELVQGATQGFFVQFGEFAAYDGAALFPENPGEIRERGGYTMR